MHLETINLVYSPNLKDDISERCLCQLVHFPPKSNAVAGLGWAVTGTNF